VGPKIDDELEAGPYETTDLEDGYSIIPVLDEELTELTLDVLTDDDDTDDDDTEDVLMLLKELSLILELELKDDED
jgi:hypothetical protein